MASKIRRKEKPDELKKRADSSFEPRPKPQLKPNRVHLAMIPLEGFFYGAFIYILLPFVSYSIAVFLSEEAALMNHIEKMDLVTDFQTNPFQNFALSLGAGVYEEAFFQVRVD